MVVQCVRCDKELESLMSDSMQPLGGTAFRSYGHYGSTKFDPLDGSWIETSLCDECFDKVSMFEGFGNG